MPAGRPRLDPNRPIYCNEDGCGVLLVRGVNMQPSRKVHKCDVHYREYQHAYYAKKYSKQRTCKCGATIPPEYKRAQCKECRKVYNENYRAGVRLTIQPDDGLPAVCERSMSKARRQLRDTIAKRMVELRIEEALSKPLEIVTIDLREGFG